ncbi:MAG TPA: hypothetical protein VJL32_01220 [Candidatus Paceibacterota bacterium]
MHLRNRHDSLIVAAVILSVLTVLAYYFIDKLSNDMTPGINGAETILRNQ